METINANVDLDDYTCPRLNVSWICPLSKKVFRRAVMAKDGITYEKKCIEAYLNDNKLSPVTGKFMRKNLHDNININKLIDSMNEMEHLRYPDVYTGPENAIKIIKCIKAGKYEELLMYKNIDLEMIHNSKLYVDNLLLKLFNKCKDVEIIKHFIDNVVDLDYADSDGWKIIHYICRYSPPENIKYIFAYNKSPNTINKSRVDLECATNDGWKPIHYICRYSEPEIIKYIIDNYKVDLECVNNDGLRPIHYICRCSTPEMIKYMIDYNKSPNTTNKSPNFVGGNISGGNISGGNILGGNISGGNISGINMLEYADDDGLRPIHYLCRYSSLQMVSYLIKKGVDLTCVTKKGETLMDYINKYSSKEVANYLRVFQTDLDDIDTRVCVCDFDMRKKQRVC